MSNQLTALLDKWYPEKDNLDWVLATIIGTDGSSYRKTGAMMIISSLGQYHGLLSGGCLESDIMRQARKCWVDGLNRTIQYDMREEEDLSWQLGIGCGGLVRILLQPIHAQNGYLALHELRAQLHQQQQCWYELNLADEEPGNRVLAQAPDKTPDDILIVPVKPVPHLAVFGGGVDAIPLIAMAGAMGWQVSLVDSRTAYARKTEFTAATRIVKSSAAEAAAQAWFEGVDAAILMNHNVSMDAEALRACAEAPLKYLGILGPQHRTERVLEAGELTYQDIQPRLSNPVGLRLGGELPESIALSMLAEIHAVLFGADGQSISGILHDR